MNGASASTVVARIRIRPNTHKNTASGNEPAFAGVAPQSPRARSADRAARGREHDQAAPDAAALCEHAISSSSGTGRADARLVTHAEPATSMSIPERLNVE